MSDQNKSDEEKKKEEDYELRIDDACQRGVVKVPKDKEKKDRPPDWSWV
ncbi:hypothetical protein M1328_02435 [Patescibacteria group bacterium]|nr:hypothetical protein [Patescibacteria group bacterium]